MSHTLLMRLAGPMQAWGVSSRFGIRETMTEPSKSGVIGLLCAALGWDRAAEMYPIAGRKRTLADLAALRFGVRVMREGVVRRDYHTAQNVLRADETASKMKKRQDVASGLRPATKEEKATELSDRFYLSDAYFLVGFESDDLPLLQALDLALASPHWPLSLGRKAFMPSHPVRVTNGNVPGLVALPLTEALLTTNPDGLSATSRFIVDAPGLGEAREVTTIEGTGLTLTRRAQRTDVPLSFLHRQFAPREVSLYATAATDRP